MLHRALIGGPMPELPEVETIRRGLLPVMADHVIKTLMEVCKHEREQAEQCAMFIHYKGKYGVKHGSYEELKPMCEAITDRGIGATVEELKG